MAICGSNKSEYDRQLKEHLKWTTSFQCQKTRYIITHLHHYHHDYLYFREA